jgi:hypothetical protein
VKRSPLRILICTVIALMASCGPRPRACPAPVQLPDQGSQSSSAPATQDSSRGVIEKEEDLTPDPRLRTWQHLYALRHQIRRFAQARERLPVNLEEFVVPGGIAYELDGWGHKIHYTTSGSGYELRALGPDGRAGTEDDMVATQDTLPTRSWP